MSYNRFIVVRMFRVDWVRSAYSYAGMMDMQL